MASIRAAVIGSPGEANGSLSMMTQLSASPTTSTPCQKLDVANSTACGVSRNCLSSCDPRRRALHENRIVERHLGDRLHGAQRRVAGEQHEGAAARALQNLDDLAAGGAREIRRPRIGHPRRQIQDRLAREVELRRQADLARRCRMPSRLRMYSNVPSTVSVADVSTVVRIRSSSSSRTIADTSIGDARRKTPRPRNSTK